MNIGPIARKWFIWKYGKPDDKLYASRFYTPDISYPKKAVWFIQIPMHAINIDNYDYVNLLCQKEVDGIEFYYLKVPVKFIHEQLDKFDRIKDNIALYLSADPKRLFIEERGKDRVSFKEFIVGE